MCVIGCLCSTLVLPWLLGRVVKSDIPESQIAPGQPLDGICQNGFLATLLIFLGGEFPIYFCSLESNYLQQICSTLLLISNIYWVLSFCMLNNVEHMKKRIDEYEKMSDDLDKSLQRKQLIGLSKHLKFQNLISIFALLMYSLILIIFGAVLEIARNGTAHGTITRYIPDAPSEGK